MNSQKLRRQGQLINDLCQHVINLYSGGKQKRMRGEKGGRKERKTESTYATQCCNCPLLTNGNPAGGTLGEAKALAASRPSRRENQAAISPEPARFKGSPEVRPWLQQKKDKRKHGQTLPST